MTTPCNGMPVFEGPDYDLFAILTAFDTYALPECRSSFRVSAKCRPQRLVGRFADVQRLEDVPGLASHTEACI